MAILHARDRAMLQAIAAILSLLLLAGVFASGVDADEDAPARSADNAGVGHGESGLDGTP